MHWKKELNFKAMTMTAMTFGYFYPVTWENKLTVWILTVISGNFLQE